MQDRLKRIQALFERAIELEPSARSEYLSRAAGGDAALVAEVEALLRHDAESNDSVFASLDDQAHEAFAAERPRRETIGKYRVVRELGQGGMGTVYLAQRDDHQYDKQVAIKLVPGVVARDELMRRFKAERQILASLDHPNIAHLLDGDTTRDGVPYVVMEYVIGVPIDRYCAEHALDVDAKLALFRQVCDAVSYAHKNLIVHRDLKPSNILVTEDGVPKLLDFGIAKILDAGEGALPASITLSSMRLMTPEYASPEQARGETVTTVSDVYSLGVLLHKLLTGKLPYDLDTRSLTDIERIICEQPASAPSALDPGVGGELDDIVLMALRKEPERRYASVDALAEDIRRYLEHLPVAARPDTRGYRAAKFLRRHRIAVTAAAAVVVAVAAGIVATGVGLIRAQRAEAIALENAAISQNVTQSFVRLFEAADRYAVTADELTLEDLLDQELEQITATVRDRPVAIATLLADLARINDRAGFEDRALEYYDEAERALLTMADPPKELMFQIYAGALDTSFSARGFEEGTERARRLIEWQQQWFADSMAHRALVLEFVAYAHGAYRQFEAALEVLLEVERLQAELESTPSERAAVLLGIGELLGDLGRHEEALSAFERARTLYESDSDPSHEVGPFVYVWLGWGFASLGEHDTALRYAEQARALAVQRFAKQSPVFLELLLRFAVLQAEIGRPEAARVAIQEVLAVYAEEGATAEQPRGKLELLSNALRHAGKIEAALANYDVAEQRLLEAMEIALGVDGPGKPIIGEHYVTLAVIAAGAGRDTDALGYLEAAVEHNYRHDDLETIPELEDYHDEPRFRQLLETHKAYLSTLEVGLPGIPDVL